MILSIGAIIALASGFNKLWYALAALVSLRSLAGDELLFLQDLV